MNGSYPPPTQQLDLLYSDIALQIKIKDNTTEGIRPLDFPDRIRAIQTKDNCTKYPIVVHTSKNATVTATNGTETVTGRADENGNVTLWVDSDGEYSLTAQKGSFTSESVNVSSAGGINIKPPISPVATNITLSVARICMAAGSNEYWAIFAGGSNNGYSTMYGTVDAFDTNLTHTVCDEITARRFPITATSKWGVVLFGGGVDKTSASTTAVEGFDRTLTKKNYTSLTYTRRFGAAATVDTKTIFTGGWISNLMTDTNTIAEIFTSPNMTKATGNFTIAKRAQLAGVGTSNNAIFAGGRDNSNYYDTVEVFDKLGVNTSTTLTLSQARCQLTGVSTGDMAVFAGGMDKTSVYGNIDWIDSDMVRWCILNGLNIPRANIAGACCKNKVLFAGGSTNTGNSAGTNMINTFDSKMNMQDLMELDRTVYYHSATSLDDKVFFAGGVGSPYSGNWIQVFEIL